MTLIKFEAKPQKEFLNLDKSIQIQILKYLKSVENLDNPSNKGKPLSGDLNIIGVIRIGDYRLICKILDNELLILDINHRSKIYKFFNQ